MRLFIQCWQRGNFIFSVRVIYPQSRDQYNLPNCLPVTMCEYCGDNPKRCSLGVLYTVNTLASYVRSKNYYLLFNACYHYHTI